MTVADLWTPAGAGCGGSWSLLVVYRFPKATPGAPVRREVVVNSGALQQHPGEPAGSVTIDGFEVAAVAPVHLAVGLSPAAPASAATADHAHAQTQTQGEGRAAAGAGALVSVNGVAVPGWSAGVGAAAAPLALPGAALPAGATSARMSFTAATGAGGYLVQAVAISTPVPAVQIVALAARAAVPAGRPDRVTVVVANSGAVPLTGVAVRSPGLPACGHEVGTVPAGHVASFACTATPATDLRAVLTVSGAPPAGPAVHDSALVSVDVQAAAAAPAHPPGAAPHPSAGPRAAVPAPGPRHAPVRAPHGKSGGPATATGPGTHPALAVTTATDQRVVLPGGRVHVRIQVRNSGDVALERVAVRDPALPACGRTIATLAAGAIVRFGCDVRAPLGAGAGTGELTSVAEASGTLPAGAAVRGAARPLVVDVQHPGLRLLQTVDHDSVRHGAAVRLTLTVLNSGDVPLAAVTVAAPLAGCRHVYARLDPGGAGSFDCTVAHLGRDLHSRAGATGVAPLGPPVLASATRTVRVRGGQTLTGVLLSDGRADLALAVATVGLALGILVLLFAPRPRRRRYRYRY